MDEKFRKKIIKDLEKSGFGSEMRAIREFLSRKWDCTGNFSYFDKDAQISREGDLHASRLKSKDLGSQNVIFRFHIAGEVKKSDNSLVGNGNYTIATLAACNTDVTTIYADMSVNGEVYTINVDISVSGDENSTNNSYSGDYSSANVNLSVPGDSYSQNFDGTGSLSGIGWSNENVNADYREWIVTNDNPRSSPNSASIYCLNCNNDQN